MKKKILEIPFQNFEHSPKRFVIKRRKKYVIYDIKKKKVVDHAETMKIAEDKLSYYKDKYKKVV